MLDLGCGEGSFVRLARKQRIDALGVDKSPPPYSNIIASPIEELHLDKKFDVVTMFHVLEHVQNPEEILEKAKGFLKKHGVLVIEVPLVGNLTEKFLGKNYFAYHDDSHLNFFSKKEIFALLTKVNLKAEKKGFTLLQFPFTVLTTSFKQNFWQAIKAVLLFFPLKLFTVLGLNHEILRVYCLKTKTNHLAIYQNSCFP